MEDPLAQFKMVYSIHTFSGGYDVSVNSDVGIMRRLSQDSYKIVCSRRDGRGIASRHLDQQSSPAGQSTSAVAF